MTCKLQLDVSGLCGEGTGRTVQILEMLNSEPERSYGYILL